MKSLPLSSDLKFFSEPLQTFLEAAAKSASNIISILLALEKHRQLSMAYIAILANCNAYSEIDILMPFDSECLFIATFFLTLFSLVHPEKVNCRFYELSYNLLDTMICNGNRAACLKKSELEYLRNILWTLQLGMI